MGYGLAGESGGEYVHGLDRGPVDGGDVTVVRYAGEAVFEDAGGVLMLVVGVVLGVPGDGAAEDVHDGQVEAAVSGAQGPDAEHAHLPPPTGSATGAVHGSPVGPVTTPLHAARVTVGSGCVSPSRTGASVAAICRA